MNICFYKGSTTVFGQKHPNQTKTKNWVLFQRVMDSLALLDIVFPVLWNIDSVH